MAFDKSKYDVEYAKAHIRRKFLPFNDQNPDDSELLRWLEDQDNITVYLKQLIKADMDRKKRDS